MPGVHERRAGLDVHTKAVVAWVLLPDGQGGWGQEIRPFGAMTAELLAPSAWLLACGCTQVASESTGDDWEPGFSILGGSCEVVLVNARHVRAVPGRKAEVEGAAWLAELPQRGLLRASLSPPVAHRALRDSARSRSPFIQARVTPINRGQKRLADATTTLAAVASESLGVSGRASLAALLTGHADPQALAELANGRRRRTRDQWTGALAGRVNPQPRFVLAEVLRQSDGVDGAVARVDARIHAVCGPFEEAVSLPDTVPGVARRAADLIGAAIGTAMTRVPRADHVASWAGVAPGHGESAGKRSSGEARGGKRVLRTIPVPAARAAARAKGAPLSAQDRRLTARRGRERAILAVARSTSAMAYGMMRRQEPCREAGADVFDRRPPEDPARRLVQWRETLGDHVTLQSAPQT